MTKATLPQLLSVTHAAQVLDCSRSHIYALVAKGHLRMVQAKASGGRPFTRIYASDLEDFITKQTRRAG